MTNYRSYACSLVLGLSMTFLAGPVSAEIRELPEEEFVRLLALHLNGGFTDIEGLARQTEAYRAADEFSRAEVTQREMERLSAEKASLGSTTGFTLNVNTFVEDYDSEVGGFPLSAMTPRTYVGHGARINLLNTEPFRYLILPVDEARQFREKSGPGAIMQVTLENLESISPEAINADVTKVVLLDRYGNQLHEIEPVEKPEMAPYQGGDQKLFSDISAEHGLISASANWDEVVAWASSFPHAAAAAGRRGAIKVVTAGVKPSDFEPDDGDSIYLIASRNEDSLAAAFRVSDRRSGFSNVDMMGNFNFSVLGRDYTCDSDKVGDTCGIVELRRNSAGAWYAAEVVAVTDFNGMTEKDVAKHVLGDRINYFEIFEKSNMISTPGIGNAGNAFPQTADSFMLGERTDEGSPLLNVRNEYQPAFGAPYIIHAATNMSRHGVAVFESRMTQEQIDAFGSAATSPEEDMSSARLPNGEHEGQGDGSTVRVTVDGTNISISTFAPGCSGIGSGTYEATGPGTYLAKLSNKYGDACTVGIELQDGVLTTSPDGCSAFHGMACGFYSQIELN